MKERVSLSNQLPSDLIYTTLFNSTLNIESFEDLNNLHELIIDWLERNLTKESYGSDDILEVLNRQTPLQIANSMIKDKVSCNAVLLSLTVEHNNKTQRRIACDKKLNVLMRLLIRKGFLNEQLPPLLLEINRISKEIVIEMYKLTHERLIDFNSAHGESAYFEAIQHPQSVRTSEYKRLLQGIHTILEFEIQRYFQLNILIHNQTKYTNRIAEFINTHKLILIILGIICIAGVVFREPITGSVYLNNTSNTKIPAIEELKKSTQPPEVLEKGIKELIANGIITQDNANQIKIKLGSTSGELASSTFSFSIPLKDNVDEKKAMEEIYQAFSLSSMNLLDKVTIKPDNDNAKSKMAQFTFTKSMVDPKLPETYSIPANNQNPSN